MLHINAKRRMKGLPPEVREAELAVRDAYRLMASKRPVPLEVRQARRAFLEQARIERDLLAHELIRPGF